MEEKMKRKIDTVLDSVKEPESGLTIAQLGLVEKLSYSEKQGRLVVFTHPAKSPKGCCLIIAKLLQEGTRKRLMAEFEKTFPGVMIEFV